MTELVYENVPYWRYFEQTVTRLRHPGVLLVVPSPNGGVNAMTIGWGTIGTIWSKAIFAVMVRPSRYTYGLMESSDSFTVCVFGLDKKDAVDYCGTYSGPRRRQAGCLPPEHHALRRRSAPPALPAAR